MLAALRNILVTVAAVLVSAGHAACGCLAAVEPAPAPENHQVAIAYHDHRAAGNDHAAHPSVARASEHGEDAPFQPDQSACSHCDAVALASSANFGGAIVGHGSFGPSIATAFVADLPSLIAPLVDATRYRLRWAAPPFRSPVDLKIRLRN